MIEQPAPASSDGMTIDSKTDALQEFGEVTIYRQMDMNTQAPSWYAEWNVVTPTVNGERVPAFGRGVTPAAAVGDLWSKFAGYQLMLKMKDERGNPQHVRWNGKWQEVVTGL